MLFVTIINNRDSLFEIIIVGKVDFCCKYYYNVADDNFTYILISLLFYRDNKNRIAIENDYNLRVSE